MARPQYLNRNGYTVVVTPHFQKQWMEARYGTGKQTMAETGANFDSVARHFDLLEAVSQNRTCGSSIAGTNANIYYKSQFNASRGRQELELISITPGTHLTTHRHKNTIRIELP